MNLITLEKRSYIILAGLLLFFEVILIFKGQWNGDFFEHSAVVNELSKNLFHPQNPIISSNTTHAFFRLTLFLWPFFQSLQGSILLLLWRVLRFLILSFFFIVYIFLKIYFPKKTGFNCIFNPHFYVDFLGTSPLSWSGFYHIFF